ncbi:hypothetical protein C0992_001475 [Termitomyces sp. T32_za158]|nr:hypothetical protein C0992_001475 [Termitomyces sp. T32_za158]
MKRRLRRRQKQDAQVPKVNPLLDNPHFRELADQRDLSEKGPRAFYNHELLSASGIFGQVQTLGWNQDQEQSTPGRSSPGSTLPPSLKDFESAIQRQMEMMESMSQRINMMALGLQAQQCAHQYTDSEPPGYDSRA